MFIILKRGWNYVTMRAIIFMLVTDTKLLERIPQSRNFGTDIVKVVPSFIQILVVSFWVKIITESWVAVFVHF